MQIPEGGGLEILFLTHPQENADAMATLLVIALN